MQKQLQEVYAQQRQTAEKEKQTRLELIKLVDQNQNSGSDPIISIQTQPLDS